MGDYFKPWRRKIGVLTLVVACVFAGLWVRSSICCDLILIPIRHDLRLGVVSSGGRFAFGRYVYQNARPNMKSDWFSEPFSKPRSLMFIHHYEELGWRSRYWSFGIRERVTTQFTFTLLQIPYWSITIPLSMLSAWLLLSKPRASKGRASDADCQLNKRSGPVIFGKVPFGGRE